VISSLGNIEIEYAISIQIKKILTMRVDPRKSSILPKVVWIIFKYDSISDGLQNELTVVIWGWRSQGQLHAVIKSVIFVHDPMPMHRIEVIKKTVSIQIYK
jgi:hypothetical protein